MKLVSMWDNFGIPLTGLSLTLESKWKKTCEFILNVSTKHWKQIHKDILLHFIKERSNLVFIAPLFNEVNWNVHETLEKKRDSNSGARSSISQQHESLQYRKKNPFPSSSNCFRCFSPPSVTFTSTMRAINTSETTMKWILCAAP